jgi:motility quorum-sensing regulator/GCU-specific mRNA interferase toxin
MEKRTPHYDLALVKRLLSQKQVRITYVALAGARELEMDETDIFTTVRELSLSCFYKSMTSHADHCIWQDVYHPVTTAGVMYLKLTVVDHLLILSFKER